MKNEHNPLNKETKDEKITKENEYTPEEQKFADGEGGKFDKAMDQQEKEEEDK